MVTSFPASLCEPHFSGDVLFFTNDDTGAARQWFESRDIPVGLHEGIPGEYEVEVSELDSRLSANELRKLVCVLTARLLELMPPPMPGFPDRETDTEAFRMGDAAHWVLAAGVHSEDPELAFTVILRYLRVALYWWADECDYIRRFLEGLCSGSLTLFQSWRDEESVDESLTREDYQEAIRDGLIWLLAQGIDRAHLVALWELVATDWLLDHGMQLFRPVDRESFDGEFLPPWQGVEIEGLDLQGAVQSGLRRGVDIVFGHILKNANQNVGVVADKFGFANGLGIEKFEGRAVRKLTD